jgi:N-acetylglucosaminyldiphosphoundecaprenol N-acetyl-beta-D-mannosaminyltransferase
MTSVFGIEFSHLSRNELISTLVSEGVPNGGGPRCVVTANLDHIVQLSQNSEFRSAYEKAWVVTADGMPVFAYARMRRAAIPERLTGADLFPLLIEELRPQQHRCFFVASSKTTVTRICHRLVSRGFAPDSIAFEIPHHGFERDTRTSETLAERIRQHRATHLFFGLGSPKSELWIDKHRDRLGDCYALSLGAALDFFAQTKKRAPVCLQKTGLEWLWRVGHEPRRLHRRYFVDSWRFLGAIKRDLATNRM